jgi:hypothetical protein
MAASSLDDEDGAIISSRPNKSIPFQSFSQKHDTE